MVERLLFIGELKNMENKLIIKFIGEDKEIDLDIDQPDLANLIHIVVAEHLAVTKDNVEVSTENTEFDKEEFLNMLIEVHEEFNKEIDTFFQNIQSEINTYYSDEELSMEIIKRIKENE